MKLQVIGAGFSGLSLAYFLKKSGHDVRIVDNNSGGLIQTVQTPYGLVESAANAMISNQAIEAVADDIGVELVPAKRESKKRYIYRKGKMRKWPLSKISSLRLIGYSLPKFIFAKKKIAPKFGETIQAWGQRQLGFEATQYLLAPALTGIYAGDPQELSASLILGRFFRPNSVEPGKLKGSVAPRKGMGEWIEKMTIWLENNGVEFSSAENSADHTFVCLPPPKAAKFLTVKAPKLAAELETIPMLSLVSVTIFHNGANGIQGFGCLFPRGEGFRVLGILANDQIFPDRTKNSRSETWIFGGKQDEKILQLTDNEILGIIKSERNKLFDEDVDFQATHIHRWPKAIPNYNLDLEAKIPRLQTENNYTPFGTYMGDLGLARVLQRAQNLARTI